MLVSYAGEAQLQPLSLVPNRDEGEWLSNVSATVARNLPTVGECPVTDIPAVLVGGGPSLAGTLESIRKLKAHGAKVFALNNAAKYLDERGIRADYQVILDSRAQNIEFVREQHADEALLCAQCDAALYEHCAKIGYPLRVWHHVSGEKVAGAVTLIGGSLTVGMSGLCVAFTMGHRQLHLFGYDSCHGPAGSHAYPQPMNARDQMVTVCVDSRAFDCSVTMAGQAHTLQEHVDMLEREGCEIAIYGDGLAQHILAFRNRIAAQRPLTAVYDLGICPADYRFFWFLARAEQYAREHEFNCIDVVFQPGPMHGFKYDDDEPDYIDREAIFTRICVSGARLSPMVRNVISLKMREAIDRPVFPEGWKEDSPVASYDALDTVSAPMLRAPEYARREIMREFRGQAYATITLREADHDPQRNTNFATARAMAQWCEDRDILAVIVPDPRGCRFQRDYYRYPLASYDAALRLALYEHAMMNIGGDCSPFRIFGALAQIPRFDIAGKLPDQAEHELTQWYQANITLQETTSCRR